MIGRGGGWGVWTADAGERLSFNINQYGMISRI